MCTVTIVPQGDGIRLACNRDESLLRPAALPPRIVDFADRRALLPIDPPSGGTWIAANDAGLVFTLLNYYASARDPAAPVTTRSRGTLIPSLLAAATLEEATKITQEWQVEHYGPFRLVMADCRSWTEIVSTGPTGARQSPTILDGPRLFTTSGLGNDVVALPRQALFEEFFAIGQDWMDRQDEYHRHSWPGRRDVSVCMQRPQSRTVSFTIVAVNKNCIEMTYYPEAPDRPAQAHSMSFHRSQ